MLISLPKYKAEKRKPTRAELAEELTWHATQAIEGLASAIRHPGINLHDVEQASEHVAQALEAARELER